MSKIIGLDIDGVLANFFTAYENLFIEVTGEDKFPARYPEALPPVWLWPEHYGYDNEAVKEVWKLIKEDPYFWVKLAPLPGAADFLRKLADSGHECYFITDRPGTLTQLQTQAWLEPVFPMASVIISRKGKGLAAKALSLELYLDDKLENIEDMWSVSPETETYMLKYPYNERLQESMGYKAVSSLEEFAEKTSLWEN